MSTDIVKAGEVLPSQEEVTAELDRLESAGDTQALHEVAARAKALQEYAAQQDSAERASYFGRVKVMAEARIGSIDLEINPRPGGTALQFGDVVVAPRRRTSWRTLGAGLQTGQLDRAMAQAEGRSEVIHTEAVTRELRGLGVTMVYVAPLLERYRQLQASEALSVREVGRRAGVNDRSLSEFLTREGTQPRQDKATRAVALRVATVLGVDPRSLKNAPFHRERAMVSRQDRPKRKLTGGRLDETYSLIRRALQELDRTAGSAGKWGTGAAWDHLYAAEEIIGKALKRAPSKDER